MKKILLATTALVATTGFAAAELTWSGSANVGLKYNGSTTLHNEIDLGAAVSGETDGGLGWKVEMGLDTDHTDATITASGDTGSVHLTGDFGTIKVGAVSSAGTSLGLPDIGFDGTNIDNAGEAGRTENTTAGAGANTGHNIRWVYGMDGVKLDVSYDTKEDDMAATVTWTSGTLNVGATFSEAGDTGNTGSGVSVGTSVGGMGVDLFAANNTTTGSSMGLAVSMPMDGLGTVTFVTADNDKATKSSWGIGFAKPLGGGATLKGAYGQEAGNDVADLGINLSF